jgi:hypothetical protein
VRAASRSCPPELLLEALAAALRGPGAGDLLTRVESLGPEPVAQAVLRRVGQLGEGARRLTRALAVFGGPVLLRHPAALAGIDLHEAARLADLLRAGDVLAPGSKLEFAHPIVRAAVYESLLPASAPWPTRRRRACSSATARRPSAWGCTCCAASRPAARRWPRS